MDAGGLRQGLNELGYVEGENLRIDVRWAHGRFERRPFIGFALCQLAALLLMMALAERSKSESE